jgi:hypothetical protein
MFIPLLLLLLRGKSPEKTKQCVTKIFSGCVVTYRTKRKFLLSFYEWENLYFTKKNFHLPLSWFHFFFVSFTEHGQPQQLFVSQANRRQHISLQEIGYFLSLIHQQIQFRYYTDANRTHHFTKATELLNQNDGYSNVLESRVWHQASLRGICGEGITIRNAYRRVLQYSCTLHKKNHIFY